MTLCVKTLYRVFPEIKAFGCCHEVFGTQKLLCKALEDILGIKDVKRQEIITESLYKSCQEAINSYKLQMKILQEQYNKEYGG